MKSKNTNLINIGYIKTKNKYHATFHISNLNIKQRKSIMKRKKTFKVANLKIFEAGTDLYVFKHFTTIEFEIYKSLVEFAKKGVIPERIEPGVLECELDICMLEEEMETHINRLSEFEKLKEY